MKHILFLLFHLPVFSFAQDCAIRKEKDQFTQADKLTTGFMPFQKGMKRIQLSLDATAKEIDFFFSLNSGNEGKCFDDASTAVVTFEGGRLKSTYRNTGSMNCQGLFHFTFKNSPSTPSALQRLATKKVLSILIKGSNNVETLISLDEEEQQRLMQAVNCMIQESKSLLP